jgi:hypothetical protein
MTAKKHTVRRLTKADRKKLARRRAQPAGWTLYRGPSLLDGAPIIVVAIVRSSNRKTGNMVQTYVLREDVSPTEAVRNGADESICGNCTHRAQEDRGRTCYVNLGQGPLAVWRAFHAGNYRPISLGNMGWLARRRMVRLGTYGDPAAVPSTVWRNLTSEAAGWTGYTHQWRNRANRARLQDLCMASVDSIGEAQLAQSQGWRTFRVQLKAYQRGPARELREATCPASAEALRKLTCSECKACSGTARGQRGNITIAPHGGFAVMAAVRAQEAAR